MREEAVAVVKELAAYPFPTFDAVIATAKLGSEAVQAWPDAARFVLPTKTGDVVRCLGCGGELTGFLVGTFTWGLSHGEGYCYRCGWPARGAHYIRLESGREQRVDVVLQYSPAEVAAMLATQAAEDEAEDSE